MIVTVDEQRRVALPPSAKPGERFDLEEAGRSGFVLTRVAPGATPVRLQRQDGYLVAITGQVITQAATRRALDEFP